MSQVPSSSVESHSWLDHFNKLFPSLRTIGRELGYNIPPDLGMIYNLAAHYNHPDRCPVVVVPGFLGSVLVDQDTGIKVWGEFSKKALNPATPEGIRLFGMAMQKGVPLQQLNDGVVATDTLAHIGGDLFGVPLHLSAYSQLLLALGLGGFRDQQLALAGVVDYGTDHYTCFQFAYDWRRDIVEAAKKLAQFVEYKRAYVRAKNQELFGEDTEKIKINLVAHSMGGLAVRYYLRYGDADLPEDGSLPPVTWAGAKHINKVVLIAPPNGGSLESLEFLLSGSHFPPGFPKYTAALLCTLPSIYQLLPRMRHRPVISKVYPHQEIDYFDPNVWDLYKWGILSPDQDRTLQSLLPHTASASERYDIAYDHLSKVLLRAQYLQRALDQPATPPAHLQMHLVAGDSVPTHKIMLVDPATGKVEISESGPGDGVVLRSSALLDERTNQEWKPTVQSPINWHRVMFLFTNHLGLTKDPTFIDNLLFELLENPG